jgi:hypothetical protein
MVFAMTADLGTPQEAARRIGAAVEAVGIERFDLMGRGSRGRGRNAAGDCT